MNSKQKSDNRRALPKFFIIIFLSAILGGVLGFLSGLANAFRVSDAVRAGIGAFLRAASPWAIPVSTAVLLGVGLWLYRSAKHTFETWNGEDETAIDAAEERLTWALLLTSLTQPIGFFFLSAATAGIFRGGEMQPLSIVGEFLVSMVLAIFFQQKIVDLTKRMNPEKQGSVYDTKFQKKWFESCDEAEQRQIGQAAYHAYRVTTTVCVFGWLVLIIGNIVFAFGLVPMFVILVIWTVQQVSYTLEAIRIARRKKA